MARAAPLSGHRLASQEVEPLDAGGSLVDGVELLVAQPGLGQVLARVPVPAVDLHRQRVRLEPLLGREGLGDGREQVEQQLGPAPLLRRDRVLGQVRLAGGLEDQRQPALHDGLLPQQHAPDVGVLDDGNLGRERVAIPERPPLRALARVGERLEVGHRRRRDPVPAHHDAGLVHHLEHVREPTPGLSEEPAPAVAGLAQRQDHAGEPAPADLVDEPGHEDVVRLVAARRGGAQPGDEEEAHALRARRGAVDAREHHVDHVLGEVLVAAGDEDLRSAEQEVIARPGWPASGRRRGSTRPAVRSAPSSRRSAPRAWGRASARAAPPTRRPRPGGRRRS